MSNRYSSSRERSRERYHGYRGRSESSSDSYEKKKKGDRTQRRTHHYKPAEPVQPKRVKFSETPDVKVFRKEDEPSSKGVSDGELQQLMKKVEAEKGSGGFSNMNWENMRHIDAQLEHNSIKKQKERQKALNENLMKVREEMPYYTPVGIYIRPKATKTANNHGAEGCLSTEREALSARLNEVLCCFYVQQSQIPPEPTFQIQNTSTSSQPKNISFDKLIIHSNRDQPSKKAANDSKPLKGILKLAPNSHDDSQPRKIDPKLVSLIREIYTHKNKYSKDQIQTMLGPFKLSGELAYVFANKEVLQGILNSGPPVPPQQPPHAPPAQNMPYQPPNQFPQPPVRGPSGSAERGSLTRGVPPNVYYRTSVSPHNTPNPAGYRQNYPSYSQPVQPQYGQPPHNPQPYGSQQNYGRPNQYGQPQSNQYGYQSQGQAPGQGPYYNSGYDERNRMAGMQSQPPAYGMGYPQSAPMMNRNYKTVACKYYHSSQGCVKADQCTFIHEEEYAGRPTPSMLKSNRGMIMQSYGMGDNQGGYVYPPPHGQ